MHDPSRLPGGVLAPGGRLAVHAGAPGAARRGFRTVDATVRASGLRTADYWIGTGREDEDWGFVLRRPAPRPGPAAARGRAAAAAASSPLTVWPAGASGLVSSRGSGQ
ncbi:hypothetical protein ACIF70_39405 [Actinacidiphila glaucinigra]|uniref:hypothetical protein n=1 Tax=Actinacidiphila glaucinigra TaxID=235986 RepID=UPI0037CA4CBF